MNIAPIKAIRFFYDTLIDFIYPPYCVFCQSLLNNGKDLVCANCWNVLPLVSIKLDILNEIAGKLRMPIYISGAHALWEFKDNVQYIIHQLKYNHHSWLATIIAKYMANFIVTQNNIDKVDLIIPVPLHKKRLRKRGYNQSILISKAIAKIIDIPVNEFSLQRIKNTVSQTKLNINQRLENVIDAFRVINKKEINQKSILLIDDVITTGSTVNACAQQLKFSGAKEIFTLSAAKA